jgi:hypothetical protein
MLANAVRAAFAEFGIVAPQGFKDLRTLIAQLEAPDAPIPEPGRAGLCPASRHNFLRQTYRSASRLMVDHELPKTLRNRVHDATAVEPKISEIT